MCKDYESIRQLIGRAVHDSWVMELTVRIPAYDKLSALPDAMVLDVIRTLTEADSAGPVEHVGTERHVQGVFSGAATFHIILEA